MLTNDQRRRDQLQSAETLGRLLPPHRHSAIDRIDLAVERVTATAIVAAGVIALALVLLAVFG